MKIISSCSPTYRSTQLIGLKKYRSYCASWNVMPSWQQKIKTIVFVTFSNAPLQPCCNIVLLLREYKVSLIAVRKRESIQLLQQDPWRCFAKGVTDVSLTHQQRWSLKIPLGFLCATLFLIKTCWTGFLMLHFVRHAFQNLWPILAQQRKERLYKEQCRTQAVHCCWWKAG